MTARFSPKGALSQRFRRPLLLLRSLFLLICLASVSGFLTMQAERSPDGSLRKAALGIARAPKMIADAFRDIWSDHFEDSLTPDDFRSEPGFVPIVNHTSRRVEGLVLRRGAGLLENGRRIVYGIFRIDGIPQYGVLAMAPDLSIEHVWTIGDDLLVRENVSVGQAAYPHGFAMLADGSMLLQFDEVYMPLRIDACGRRLWTGEVRSSHAIHPTDDGRQAWAVGKASKLQLFDLTRGKSLRAISFDEIRAANPDLSILDMRRIDDNALGANPKGDAEIYFDDPYHVNDVDPLPAALAPAFPQFAAGDLLVSARSLNLVMVVDPRTLRVKWFSNDITLRQHDPNWEANGRISVFDNQNGRQFSRIIEFDPARDGHRVRVDGSRYRFYSRIRGKQQSLPGGGVLITSSQQGRILEIDPQGRVAFDLLVRDPANPGRNFVVSQATWFEPQSPAVGKALACPNS